ncbi:outer membrane protein transport protein [Pseudomonas cyclaminis]|uniref:outer membrane protein transport protein n=1 Tax=Pseudomonas cyclaminis TaxID=2781239 RepID=UPI00187F7C38|nr:outer membrane protein transport protein [Pseudomonas cyclaminis]MBE8598628.1 outer membrane protein transport protein [Pseudomonas cyclaminis]
MRVVSGKCRGLKKNFSNYAALFFTLGISTGISAGGLTINEQSASSAGTAYAGRSSSAMDASTIFGNPAGLTKLKQAEVSGGFAVVDVKTDISDAKSSVNGTNKGNSVPLATVPFGYISTPINENFSVGLGVYVPNGVINDTESTYQGRYHGSYSSVKVITVQPTIAYRINDRISIGGGPTINRFSAKLDSELATGALNSGKDTQLNIKVDDSAIGYNIGLLVDLDDSTTWGVTYRSKVDYHMKGHTTVSDSPGFLDQNGKYDAKIDITLPESLDTSITHHFNDRWTGYVGANWTRWSRLKKIETVNSGVSALGQLAGLNDLVEPLNWRDTWSAALGAAYQLNPEWVLRAGYAYDPSPIDNASRSVRVSTGNRQSVTLGAGYSPRSDLTIDVAYGYVWESTAPVNLANTTGVQPAYSAKFDNSANGLVTQVSYRF